MNAKTIKLRKAFTWLLLVSAVGFICRGASAQLVYSVNIVGFYPFSFPSGASLPGRTESNGMTWAAAGPVGPPITIASNSLAVPGLAPPAGNSARIAGVNGPAARVALESNLTSGTVFYSLALRVQDLGTLGASGGPLVGLGNATGPSQNLPSPLAARLIIRSQAPGSGHYALGISPNLNAPPTSTFGPTDDCSIGLTDFVVCSYTFVPGPSNDVVKLWMGIDPATFGQSNAPPADLVATSSSDIDRISSIALIQRAEPILPPVTIIDEIRAGTTWASVTPPGMDFGDAPEGAYPYPTTLARNGARHGGGPLFFGARKDLESDGTPTVPADGDDLAGGPNDEDGIVFGGVWVPGGTAWVDITASAPGRVDAYIDWNQMSAWEPAEKIINNQPVTPGAPVRFTFTVPSGIPTGDTYVRFRLSATGGLSPVGFNPNGEVLDFRVTVFPRPNLIATATASPNPTIDASNLTISVTVSNTGAGAASGVVVSNVTFPQRSFPRRSSEGAADGVLVPSGFWDASWDDWFRSVIVTPSQGSWTKMASGVVWNLGTLQPGAMAAIHITGIPSYDELGSGLNIPNMQETIDVTNSVTVTSAETGVPKDNSAVVIIPIVPQRDFGDAPQPPYPTLLPSAARHRVGALRFGTLIDAEPNGQPVNQDDVIGANDEMGDGGIGVLPGYYLGGAMPFTFRVFGPQCFIELWIDLDGVAGWGPADHVLVTVPHPGGGAVVGYAPMMPAGAGSGTAWARARVHLNPAGLPPGGYGGFGEVGDFQVNILPAAIDLVVAEPPAAIEVTEGDPLTLTLTVSNKGPSTATGTTLEVHFPPGATLDNLQTSQGSGQMEGTNLVVQLGTLAPNASATVTFTAGTSNVFEGIADEFWWWCFDVFATEPELNPDDNMHHGSVRVVAKRDFGDAPNATLGAAYNYPTRLVDNGARHRIVGPYFGGSAPALDRDPDPDGMPTLNADGDDLADANDDEQGIQFLDPIYPGATGVRVRINAPVGGRVDAWADFNRNGRWSMGAPEQIFTSLPVAAGTFDYTFNVPAGAVVGSTYARFRISTAGGLAFTGYATNGEIQDTKLEIVPVVDLVAVADPAQITMTEGDLLTQTITVSNPGPYTASNVQLTFIIPPGLLLQAVSRWITSVHANCIVQSNNVICPATTLAAQESFMVKAMFEVDPQFAAQSTSESFAINLTAIVSAAEPDLNPADNQVGIPVFVFFARDWGDAPEGYPVTNAENGARHRRDLNLKLGTQWDLETEGTHSPGADYDDLHGPTPDDEDGVVFVATTGTITVDVTVTGDGYVNAWMDFNRDTDWDDLSEHILIDEPFHTETRRFYITVPSWATAGTFVSRWRVNVGGGLTPRGPGGKGEVEDYAADWVPEQSNNPVYFAGLRHTALQNAMLSVSSNGLQISNLGSNGQDGVSIALGEAEGWLGTVEAPLNPASAPEGDKLSWSIYGTVDGVSNRLISTGRMEVTGGGVNAYADFAPVGSPTYSVSAYSNGVLVASNVVPAGSAAYRFPGPGPGPIIIKWEKPIPDDDDPTCGGYWIQPCPIIINLPNGPLVNANEVRVKPVSATSSVESFSRTDFSLVCYGFWRDQALVLRDEAVKKFGLFHTALGAARLNLGGDVGSNTARLAISDVGSSGEDGLETFAGHDFPFLSTDASPGRRMMFGFDVWSNADVAAPESPSVQWTATGHIQGSVNSFENLADLSAFKQEQGTALTELTSRFDALGATQVKVDVFNGPDHVGSVTVPTGSIGTLNFGFGIEREMRNVGVVDSADYVVWLMRFAEPVTFTPPFMGAALTGDRLRIAPADPQLKTLGLRSLITRAAGVESFTLRNASTAEPQRPGLNAPRFRPDRRFELTFPTEPDVLYEVERSRTLLPGSWTPIGMVMGTDGMSSASLLDPEPGNFFSGFYRIRVQ